ncbi:MAG: hypothetical protein M1828_007424 [Chrysothrix sp. TS-e1954]|nr:MAG: hypothetical protein M1828_007424 [Chrysothrix sp. TS-e1954]
MSSFTPHTEAMNGPPSPTLRHKAAMPTLPSPRRLSPPPQTFVPGPNAFVKRQNADQKQKSSGEVKGLGIDFDQRSDFLQNIKSERDRLDLILRNADKENSGSNPIEEKKEKPLRLAPSPHPPAQPTQRSGIEDKNASKLQKLLEHNGRVSPNTQVATVATRRTPTPLKISQTNKANTKAVHGGKRRSDERPVSPRKGFLARMGLGPSVTNNANMLGSSPEPEPQQDSSKKHGTNKEAVPAKAAQLLGTQSLNDRHQPGKISRTEMSSLGALDLADGRKTPEPASTLPKGIVSSPRKESQEARGSDKSHANARKPHGSGGNLEGPALPSERAKAKPQASSSTSHVTKRRPTIEHVESKTGDLIHSSDDVPPTPPSKPPKYKLKGSHEDPTSLDTGSPLRNSVFSFEVKTPGTPPGPVTHGSAKKNTPKATASKFQVVSSQYGSVHNGATPLRVSSPLTDSPGSKINSLRKEVDAELGGYYYTPSIYDNGWSPTSVDRNVGLSVDFTPIRYLADDYIQKFYPSPLHLQTTARHPSRVPRNQRDASNTSTSQSGSIQVMLDSPPRKTAKATSPGTATATATPATHYDPFDAFPSGNTTVQPTPNPADDPNKYSPIFKTILETSLKEVQNSLTSHFQDLQLHSEQRSADIHDIITSKLNAFYNQELPYITRTLHGMEKSIKALFHQNESLVRDIAELKTARSSTSSGLSRRSPHKAMHSGDHAQLHRVDETAASTPTPSPPKHNISRSLDTAQSQTSPSRSPRSRRCKGRTRGQPSQAQSAPADVEAHPAPLFTLAPSVYSGRSRDSERSKASVSSKGVEGISGRLDFPWSPSIPPTAVSPTIASAAKHDAPPEHPARGSSKRKDSSASPPHPRLRSRSRSPKKPSSPRKETSAARKSDSSNDSGMKQGAEEGQAPPKHKRTASYKDYFSRLGIERGEPDLTEHPAFKGDRDGVEGVDLES